MSYDALIIGAGPGGITSAINLAKEGFKIAIIEYSMPGGKVNIAPRVDNYPNYPKIIGPDLAMVFFNRLNDAKIEYIPAKVQKISKNNGIFVVETSSSKLEAKAVIVASGTDEKKLNLPNEKELLGHGLSYCAICDGHFFKDKITMVIAEDKYAINEAIYLAKLSSKVYVVTSKDRLPGDKHHLEELNSFSNVEYIFSRKVVELKGYPLSSVILDDGTEIIVNGIFPLLGYIPNTSFLSKDLLDEDGFVITDRSYQSKLEGMFAIGDVLSRELKQIYLAERDANLSLNPIKDYLLSRK